jgi:hypothetical protein
MTVFDNQTPDVTSAAPHGAAWGPLVASGSVRGSDPDRNLWSRPGRSGSRAS